MHGYVLLLPPGKNNYQGQNNYHLLVIICQDLLIFFDIPCRLKGHLQQCWWHALTQFFNSLQVSSISYFIERSQIASHMEPTSRSCGLLICCLSRVRASARSLTSSSTSVFTAPSACRPYASSNSRSSHLNRAPVISEDLSNRFLIAPHLIREFKYLVFKGFDISALLLDYESHTFSLSCICCSILSEFILHYLKC